MGKANFTDEFKLDAIKQITERGYSVVDVSRRLGVSTHSLYSWMKRYNAPEKAAAQDDQLVDCVSVSIFMHSSYLRLHCWDD
ncbi:transposase [Ochrobactrum sp. MR28]|nr:transposase [Ochrobactrum sp. MR28]MBX8818750.1 transposase [Ochrobactrum sp. MR31]